MHMYPEKIYFIVRHMYVAIYIDICILVNNKKKKLTLI